MSLSPRLLVLFLFVVGCAPTNMAITYYTQPEGGTFLGPDGHSRGQSPLTLYYEITPEHMQACQLVAEGITARWVSGAMASVPSLAFNVCQGVEWSYRVDRPADAPKYDLDLWHASEQARARQHTEQTKMLKDMQMLQMMGAINQLNQQNQLNQIQQQQQYLQQQYQMQQQQIQQQQMQQWQYNYRR